MDRININVFKGMQKKKEEKVGKGTKEINSKENTVSKYNNKLNINEDGENIKNIFNNLKLNDVSVKYNFSINNNDIHNKRKIITASELEKTSQNNKLELCSNFNIKVRSQPTPNTNNKITSTSLSKDQKIIKDILVSNVKKNKLTLGTKQMMENEKQHAIEAIESGIYITWTSKTKIGETTDCFRIGSNSTCLCGHGFQCHEKSLTRKKLLSKCLQSNCNCRSFIYIPIYPEEIGEYWQPYQHNFDYSTWKAKCKCKHNWSDHSVELRNCRNCNCFAFNSNFCCVVCDQFWQDHEMIYELEHERYMSKKPIADDFMPFAEMPEMYSAIFKK